MPGEGIAAAIPRAREALGCWVVAQLKQVVGEFKEAEAGSRLNDENRVE